MDTQLVALLCLAALAVLAERWGRRQTRRGARRTVEHVEALFRGTHELVSVDPARFDWLDGAWYDATRLRLEAEGFRLLGDVEDLTLSEQSPHMRTFIRVMSGDRGRVTVGAYHVKLTGLLAPFQWLGIVPRRARILELESELSDGRFLVTNNTRTLDTTPSPAAVELEQLPLRTAHPVLLERHRERLRAALESAPGLEALRVESLSQAIDAQHRLQRLKNEVMADREAIVRTVQGQRGSRAAKEALAREIRRA